MVACEECGRWQHAECVSIPDELHVPRHYFCPVCRPDLYLPSPVTSMPPSKPSPRITLSFSTTKPGQRAKVTVKMPPDLQPVFKSTPSEVDDVAIGSTASSEREESLPSPSSSSFVSDLLLRDTEDVKSAAPANSSSGTTAVGSSRRESSPLSELASSLGSSSSDATTAMLSPPIPIFTRPAGYLQSTVLTCEHCNVAQDLGMLSLLFGALSLTPVHVAWRIGVSGRKLLCVPCGMVSTKHSVPIVSMLTFDYRLLRTLRSVECAPSMIQIRANPTAKRRT